MGNIIGVSSTVEPVNYLNLRFAIMINSVWLKFQEFMTEYNVNIQDG